MFQYFVDKFKSLLNSLGLFQKNGKILFLGLDNSGKTTLMRRLKDGRFVQHDPSLGATSEELTIGNIRLKAFDLGGHEAVRKAWKNYYANIDGIIYLVDSSDQKRFQESREEFMAVLQNETIKDVPIVILGNKIDIFEAVNEDHLRLLFGLGKETQVGVEKMNEINGRPIELFMCSISKNVGYDNAFKWIGKYLK